jgi:hypothetical protein
MRWLVWRQHRLQWALAVAAVAAFAIPIVVTGARHGCAANSPCVVSVSGQTLAQTLVNLTVAVPALIGAFWGATLTGRELETGTSALVWTQSITRRQWLRAKIATLLVAAAVSGAVVSSLVTWWARPGTPNHNNRFEAIHFDTQGIVPVAYALFAAGLGLSAGALWRRVVAAMATTVLGFLAVRLTVELLARPHYMSPVVKVYAMKQMDPTPAGAMGLGTDLLQHGQVVTGSVRVACGGPDTTREAMNACMDRLGYQFRTTYQPPGRYWTFQWIEFGIFVAFSAALIGYVIWRIKRSA